MTIRYMKNFGYKIDGCGSQYGGSTLAFDYFCEKRTGHNCKLCLLKPYRISRYNLEDGTYTEKCIQPKNGTFLFFLEET